MWSFGETGAPLTSQQAAAGSPGRFPSGISPGILAKVPASGSTRAPANVPDGQRNSGVMVLQRRR